MSWIGRQVLPFAVVVVALALVTSACRAVLEQQPAGLQHAVDLHPIPPPLPVRARVAARPLVAVPLLAEAPPAAALAAFEAASEEALEVVAQVAVAAARDRRRRAVLETGTASWYGPGFAGRPTASGETFDPSAMTAAHPELPLGTEVVVVNLANGREARLRINDRGPFIGDRVIDVSRGAAEALGFYYTGIAEVRVHLLAPADAAAARPDA